MAKKIVPIHKMLHVDYKRIDNIALSKQVTLRRVVGILGMALPLLLFISLLIDTGYASPLPSISHYYFTRVCSIFVSTLSILAVFLLIYKGEEPLDFYLSGTAGIFALCVVLFPTDNIDGPFVVTVLKLSKFRVIFHYISAAIFLSCLAAMSLFLFTKSDKPVKSLGTRKKIRNRLYRICGGFMIVAILLILARGISIFGDAYDRFYDDHLLTFWMETLAVESFGLSWLVKGETLFRDKQPFRRKPTS